MDTEQDYEVLQNIFNNVYTKNNAFTMNDVLEYLNDNPDVLQNNEENDVFHGKGQKLYKEAKKLIPEEHSFYRNDQRCFTRILAILLSKSYWNRSSHIRRSYERFFVYGVACILGYKDPNVNREVHQAVDRGNMCTLNCPSEVELTKPFLELHP